MVKVGANVTIYEEMSEEEVNMRSGFVMMKKMGWRGEEEQTELVVSVYTGRETRAGVWNRGREKKKEEEML